MNILEIDAINFAGRVGHVGAAELTGLLVHGDVQPEAAWFTGEVGAQASEAITEQIDRMAQYVAGRGCSGETLYRAFRGNDWDKREPWLRMAYDLFASTVSSIAAKLLADQRAAEQSIAREAERAAQPALKLEDSILEPEESLGAMRPEAIEAQKQYAALKKAQAAQARLQRKLEAARERQEKVASDVSKIAAEAEQAKQAAERIAASLPPTPMSIGEAPASPPVNRGGRGRKKR